MDWQPAPFPAVELARRPPGVRGTLYEFVRRHLVEQGGMCSRTELLAAIQASPAMCDRLMASRGFTALLSNMRHSGDLLLDGDKVQLSSRSLRRLGLGKGSPTIGWDRT